MTSSRSDPGRRSPGTCALMVRADARAWRPGTGSGESVARRSSAGFAQAGGGTREGLTRAQAEAELRRLMAEVQAGPSRGERKTIAEAAGALIARPHGGGPQALDGRRLRVDRQHPLRAVLRPAHARPDRAPSGRGVAATLARDGLVDNARLNILNLLNSLFEFALERGWTIRNPMREVPRTRGRATDPDPLSEPRGGRGRAPSGPR